MELLIENWAPVLVLLGLSAMHLIGHRRTSRFPARSKAVTFARIKSRSRPLDQT